MLPAILNRRSTPRFWNAADLDRLFDFSLGEGSLAGWSPAVDITETADGFAVDVELPGIDADDVEVTVNDGVLSVSGERRDERESNKGGRHLVERRYGKFERSFSLPNSVDPGKVDAKFVNGVLKVTLPKSTAAKPRKIEVR